MQILVVLKKNNLFQIRNEIRETFQIQNSFDLDSTITKLISKENFRIYNFIVVCKIINSDLSQTLTTYIVEPFEEIKEI